ncbi:MAG: hypothetical protein SV062_11690 [Thermodesulfobacteriota bacterium]|nr:hypothetical protein [Thermodesulfobacteriota bacterium]
MLKIEPFISERNLAWSSGVPIEVSRGGESPAFRAGKGQILPACEPDRVTVEAMN